ncbi:hypothetical protein [Natrinema versiforme]|uniref:hypothetical protein n=1 Tax=Natrinema versiforme TaxID=88724 RepID=UPI00126906F0|nr:hypothetical protein [Natrinema versiforme]
MADIELELEDELITVDDYNQQRRFIAAKNGSTWRIFEGVIDGPQALSKRTTVETSTQVLVEALRWLTEDD